MSLNRVQEKEQTQSGNSFRWITRKPFKGNICLFRVRALHLLGNEKLEEETFKLFNQFLGKTSRTAHTNFRDVLLKLLHQWRTLFK